MSTYLISFPSGAMDLTGTDIETVAEDSHAVVAAARAAGVWVFGGGIDESVPPVRVAADGTVTPGTYPETARLEGGYSILDCPDRVTALEWAARFAAACRCPQEVRVFGDDPSS